jgi:hypothetical protein
LFEYIFFTEINIIVRPITARIIIKLASNATQELIGNGVSAIIPPINAIITYLFTVFIMSL